MGLILRLHGDLRWIVALLALVVITKFTLGLVRRDSFERIDRVLFAATTGFMDLNLLLGTILLVGLGNGFPRHRIEHAITQILAILVMHSSTYWQDNSSSQIKFRNGLLTVLIALIIIFIGIIRLRGGWTF
ncbi:MAG: hypothetical protein AAF614_20980 [Chloroflexota bacterium]